MTSTFNQSTRPFADVPLYLPLVRRGVCQTIDSSLVILLSNIMAYNWEHPSLKNVRFSSLGSYQFLVFLQVETADVFLSLCFGRQQISGYGFWSADEIFVESNGLRHGLTLTQETRGYVQPGYYVYGVGEREEALLNFHVAHYKPDYRRALNLEHVRYIGSMEQTGLVYPNTEIATSTTVVPFLVESQSAKSIAKSGGNVLEPATLITNFAATITEIALQLCPTYQMLTQQSFDRFKMEA